MRPREERFHRCAGALNQARVLEASGRLDEAVGVLKSVAVDEPEAFVVLSVLGRLQAMSGLLDDSRVSFERALALDPSDPGAHVRLGSALIEAGQFSAGIQRLQEALRLNPVSDEALLALSQGLAEIGRVPEALELIDEVLARHSTPDEPLAQIRLVFLQALPGISPGELLEEHRQWGALRCSAGEGIDHKAAGSISSGVMGFLSGDFRQHPVGIFSVGLVECLARRGIRICIFDTCGAVDDSINQRFRRASNAYHMVSKLDDAALARLILHEQVEVLFDLSGHTAGNRLGVFCERAAPVQISWAGYVGTTGIENMDFLVADSFHLDGDQDRDHVEAVIRMPAGYVVFDPPQGAPDPVTPPVVDRGFVTFGCFNAAFKYSDELIALWAQILLRVEGSRLLLVNRGLDDPAFRERLEPVLNRYGVDPGRVLLKGWQPRPRVLEYYQDVDIALDSWPYSGGLTTLEALWMGVPVITCPGDTFASRHSRSHLSVFGWVDGIATDHADYVDRAVRLAASLPALEEFRHTARARMRASPLMDAEGFADALLERISRAKMKIDVLRAPPAPH